MYDPAYGIVRFFISLLLITQVIHGIASCHITPKKKKDLIMIIGSTFMTKTINTILDQERVF